MFNMSEVSERIMLARKNKGMTQMELANALGISYQAVSNWERGVSMPDISNLEPLASVLGVTVDEILSDKKIASLIKDGEIPDEISAAEFNAVSPLLGPEQNEELIKKINVVDSADEEINTESLCKTRKEYEKLVLNAYENEQLPIVTLLFSHCSPEFIDTLADRAFDEGKLPFFAVLFGKLRSRIPDEKRASLLKRAVECGNIPFVALLSPRHRSKDPDDSDEED